MLAMGTGIGGHVRSDQIDPGLIERRPTIFLDEPGGVFDVCPYPVAKLNLCWTVEYVNPAA